MEACENKTGNVFLNRNYRLVFFGALVSELGAVLYSFAVGFYLLEISDNNAVLQGSYLALCGVTLLLVTPLGGVLGDRRHKAKIMFVCDYLRGGGILLATLGLLVLPESRAQIVILFVAGILGNAIGGIFSPAAGALLPHIVEEEQLQQANAYFSMRSALQSILGVVLAGVLYALLPIALLFVVVGVCYVLSGVSEMFIRYEHKVSDEKMTLRLVLTDMRDGLRYLNTQRAILAIMAGALFINFFFSPVASNFVPYFIKTDVAGAPGYLFDRLLTPELWSSVFSVLIALSSLVAAGILSARPQADKCGYKVALRIGAMSCVMIALALGYWLLVARGVSLNAFLLLFALGCVLVGFLVSMINIPMNTAMMRVVDKGMLSKVSSIISVLSQGLVPISSVLAGLVLQYLGSAWLLAGGALGLTVTSLVLLGSRHIREI